jgi:predicted thioesterase
MHHQVTDDDTAIALGSGDVPVLATPRLLAWLEAATVDAATVYTEPGQTTVGTVVKVRHLRATPVGGSVECVAVPRVLRQGSVLAFAVEATDETGEVIAEGEIERAVVERERFLDGITPQ